MGIKRHISVFTIAMVLCCSAYQLFAQDNPIFNKLSEKFDAYTTHNRPEKVYLQTDKDYYTNGDTLWFKTYLLDGVSHTISNQSRVVYVELLDSEQKVVERRRIYSGFAGGSGDIALSENILEGSYFLRAYTKYMLNEREPVFFQKEIPIWTYTIDSKKSTRRDATKNSSVARLNEGGTQKVTTKPRVQFFPEGGHLVSGLTTVLGLKITNNTGAGIPLTGKITNQHGTLITMFSTAEFGLGRVPLKVEPKTDYFAEIEINRTIHKYEISKPLAKGYVLQVSNKGDYLQLRVSTTIANGLNGSMLLGHVRGESVLKHIAQNRTANSYELKLSTAALNNGVGTFTLFTPEGEPVCERLVFIENPNNALNLSVKTNASNYQPRTKVSIDLSALDNLGLPLSGNLSMSVVSQNGLKNEAENIKSWLLLNSDLGGTVENANYFFKDSSKSRKNLLDILMLTHGWRRFVWKDFRTSEANTELQFPPEKGLIINGKTVSSTNRKEPVQRAVSLTIAEPSAYKEEALTDSQGKFSFGPMIFRDSIRAVIQASYEMDDKKEAAIYVEPSFPTIPIKDSLRYRPQNIDMAPSEAYREEVYKKKANDFEYDPKVIKLDEAIGRGKLKTKKELINEALNERTMHGQAVNRIIPDSILDSEFYSVIDLIERKVSGVRVKGAYPKQEIEIRGRGSSFLASGPPLYLLDGIALTDPSLILEMFGSEVLFIDVLKRPEETAQYGVRGRFGVIAVYTDRGENYEFVQERELDAANFILPGFYRAREFYSPTYPPANGERGKPDFRTTLFWQPDIKVSDMEPTNLSFYTGDTPGGYDIRVDGMTQDGRPISGTYSFTVGEDR